MAQPELILIPFADDASPGYVDEIPDALPPGADPQYASWSQGFPPVTMTPLAAGGIPPRGQSFNGVLKAISEHTVFVGGGGRYKWDNSYAVGVGYAIGAIVQKAGNDGYWQNTVASNSTNPDAGGAGWIDASMVVPYGTDTGSANIYIVAYSPARSALIDGMVLCFKAATANTAASTFNPNGLGAKPVIGMAHSPLQGGEIIAGGDVWVQYNSAIGSGSWVLLLSSGGSLQVAPGTKSQHAMQIAQATGRLVRISIYTLVAGVLKVSINGAAPVTAASTFIPFNGAVNALVEAIGGGGGGGGCGGTGAGQVAAAGGGSGGGYAASWLPVATLSGLTLSVGAGGTSAANTPGTSGGSTSVGGLIVGGGGGGGTIGTPIATPSGTSLAGGTAGGVGSGGNLINAQGGAGNYSAQAPTPISGAGGFSVLGSGAVHVSGTTNGIAAVTPGAGGSGSSLLASIGGGAIGGVGASGQIKITEYA